MAFVAAGVAAASIAGSAISASAAGSAAGVQAQAAEKSQQLIQGMFQQGVGYEQPYMQLGNTAAGELEQQSGPGGYLTSQFNPTVAQLQQTPGYQFDLTQGLESTQNSFAAMGLGTSGAAEKGAANFATGLAQNTWQQQWQQQLAQKQQIYGMLQGETNTGAGAANQSAALAGTAAQAEAGAITGGAAAQAGGIVGTANAISGGLTGVANAAGLYGATSGNGNSIFGPSSGNAIFGPNPTSGQTAQIGSATLQQD